MLASEYAEFEALIRKLEKLYGKAIDDDTLAAYWAALRELPLGLVRRRIDEHIKRQKFFPKPAELRPKDEKPERSPDHEKSFQAAVDRNVRNWDEGLRTDPLGTKWLLLDAYVARIGVQEDPSSVVYAEKMAWARDVCERLISESGWEYAGSHPFYVRTISQLLGGEAMKRALEAHSKKRSAA